MVSVGLLPPHYADDDAERTNSDVPDRALHRIGPPRKHRGCGAAEQQKPKHRRRPVAVVAGCAGSGVASMRMPTRRAVSWPKKPADENMFSEQNKQTDLVDQLTAEAAKPEA